MRLCWPPDGALNCCPHFFYLTKFRQIIRLLLRRYSRHCFCVVPLQLFLQVIRNSSTVSLNLKRSAMTKRSGVIKLPLPESLLTEVWLGRFGEVGCEGCRGSGESLHQCIELVFSCMHVSENYR